MNRRWFRSVFLAASFVVGTQSTTDAEERWSLPKLMPFSSQNARPVQPPKKKTTLVPSLVRPASALIPDVTGITDRLPKLDAPLDRLGDGAKRLHRNTTRVLTNGAEKIGDDTKAILAKSKAVLSPWPQTSEKSSRRTAAGAGGGLLTLPKWWSADKQKPKDQPPQTMSDWLRQPRPEY